MVLADPEGSILTDVIEGRHGKQAGSWLVEGIGEDFVPSMADLSLVKKAYSISDRESFQAARELLRKEGILAGSSSGTLLAAALRYCHESRVKRRVVSFVCDTGNKYLSRFFDDAWLADYHLLDSQRYDDLRDLIARPFQNGDVISLHPDDNLAVAYGRMKTYSISQFPVLHDGRLVGILDESDLLLAISRDSSNFQKSVSSFMTEQPVILSSKDDLMILIETLRNGLTALIEHDGKFAGIVTKIDLIHYLRNRETL
jgi:cystathionine beta-synthase